MAGSALRSHTPLPWASTSSHRLLLAFFAAFACLLCGPRPTSGEMFTALVEMTRLFDVEHSLADSLDSYVDAEMARLEQVRAYAADLRHHATSSMGDDPERHLANPVNAFLLTKRFTTDFTRNIDDLIKSHEAEKFLLDEIEFRKASLPDMNDLNGAAQALMRLQDTYHLVPRLIARGQIHQSIVAPEMSADDCFFIGVHAFDNDDFYHARQWMEESLTKLEPHLGTKHLNRSYVLDYLSYVVYKQGNLRYALALTNEWLTIDPDNQRAITNKGYFESQLQKETSAGAGLKGDNSSQSEDPAVVNGQRPHHAFYQDEFKTYEALCRNEDIIPYNLKDMLYCRYYVPHPAYILGPVKEEIMYFRPRIVVWHEIIHPKEMARIKALAAPRLNRATVQNAVTGKLEFANYRISKSAWLVHETDEVTARINDRITRLTGLDLDTAEELQVVNYGIGGHYEPHYDFARRRERNSFEVRVGNRIATLIYYLSNVEAGGATVFVHLGIKLWPRAGSAAFWYNLKHNGEGDLITRHAACPVLTGSKWVMNKWFHERGQEFRRPCALKNVDYEY